jgi:signal transduction histidine kinase
VTRRYSPLPPVPVYVDELNQVWTNLIHNAVQALQGRGSITIETEPRDQGVAVRIIDDGPGIDGEVMPRIFDPFFTTKPKGEGTGLGLRIVRNIVDKHGGTVTATSRPGQTCFEVWLPAPAESVTREKSTGML